MMFPLSHASFYTAFRIAYLLVGALAVVLLWRRPRAGAALGVIVVTNLAAWAAYVWPLGRLYALNELSDMSFNVGAAACAAATGNPFDHTQVRFAHLEPFWSATLALLSFGQPAWVLPLYAWLAPLVLVVVALGMYYGLREASTEEDRWERALIVLAVLGLSSWAQSRQSPIPPLWPGNFLLKANHAAGWGLVGVALGAFARRMNPWRAGLMLGLLAWVFLLDWAFLWPGLVLGTLLRRDVSRRDWSALVKAFSLSFLIAVPYILHLTRDHNPLGHGDTPAQIWLDHAGLRLKDPRWVTLDLWLLLALGLAGAATAFIRRTGRDALLLGTLGGSWALWLAYQVGAHFKVTPEADEQHYFLRIALAMTAGAGIAAAGRALESRFHLGAGRGAVLMLAVCWPFTFPAHWDPPTMDRYFPYNLDPIPQRVQAYAHWIRENTPRGAVFAAGPNAATWIPVLTGRRILIAAETRPPADYPARKQAERALLLSRDPAVILDTARRFGVTHLAIDAPLTEEYGDEALKGIGRLPVFDVAYADKLVRILAIRTTGGGPGATPTSTEEGARSSGSP
jgi:hypothetical protein